MILTPFYWPTVKILPLDFTAHMTDYEYITHVCAKLNEIIHSENATGPAIAAIQKDLEAIQKELEAITNGDYSFLKQIIENAIKNVWFGLTQDGRFVAYIPESWQEITFGTTGLDSFIDCHPEFGRLLLSY